MSEEIIKERAISNNNRGIEYIRTTEGVQSHGPVCLHESVSTNDSASTHKPVRTHEPVSMNVPESTCVPAGGYVGRLAPTGGYVGRLAPTPSGYMHGETRDSKHYCHSLVSLRHSRCFCFPCCSPLFVPVWGLGSYSTPVPAGV